MTTMIKQYFQAPHFEDERKNQRAYMLNVILVIMLTAVIVVGGIYMIAQIGTGQSSATITFLFIRLSVGMIVSYIFLRLGNVNIGGLILVALFLWFSFYLLPETETLNSSFVLTFVLPIVMSTLILGSRAGIMTALISALLILVAARNEVTSVTDLLLSLWTFYIGIYLSLAFLLRLSTNRLGQTMSALNETNEALQQSYEKVELRVQERTNDLALSAEISRSLAQERDLERLLANAAERIRSRFDLYYTQIYLIDREKQNLVLRAGTGPVGLELLRSNHKLPFNASSINGAAAVNRTSIIVANTEESRFFRRNPLLPDTRSEMAIPLVAGETVVGVIDLQSSQPQALSESNTAAFEIIAGQLTIAIENARLLRDTNQVREELELRIRSETRTAWDHYLNAINRSESIGYRYDEGAIQPMEKSVTGAFNEHILTTPILLAGEAIGSIDLESDTGSLSKADTELLQAVAHRVSQQIENLRLLGEAEQYRHEAEAATTRLVREGWDKMSVMQAKTGFYYDQKSVHALGETEPAVSEAAVIDYALTIQGAQIGKLEVVGAAREDEKTAAMVTAVASRLSAHIENLRLNEQTEQALAQAEQRSLELNVLNEMGAAFTSAREADQILNYIHQFSKRLISETANLTVALYNEALDEMTLHLFYKPGEETTEDKLQSIIRRQSGNGITEYILRSRQPLLVKGNMAEMAQKLGFTVIGQEATAWMGVPMVVGDRAVGVIAMQSFQEGQAYNERDLDLFTAMASSAAISLEGIRLLQQVQSRARQEQILREVTARVHAAVDTEAIMRTAAQEINRRLGLETFVYLDNEQVPEPETLTANGRDGRDANN